jgi:hypothetical protein
VQWLRARVAAVIALVVGATVFVAAAALRAGVWDASDARVAGLGAGATVVVAAISLVRREPARGLVMAAVGMAGAAVVIGWLIEVAVVIAAVAVALAVLHAVM